MKARQAVDEMSESEPDSEEEELAALLGEQ